MEQNRMTFEKLWEQNERQGLQLRLQHDYPAWKRRHKQRMAMVCTFAVFVAVGISIVNYQVHFPRGYDGVKCNRSGIANSHWVAVASNILTIEGNV